MSGSAIEPVATLATAKTLADLLPPEGRMELMRHLMSRATPQCMARFMAEMPAMTAKLGVALPATSAPPARSVTLAGSGPEVAAEILASWHPDPEEWSFSPCLPASEIWRRSGP